MSRSNVAPSIADYEGFDFRALWSTRERVSEVERAVVDRALDSVDPSRILEVGTGFGRLTTCLTNRGGELVVSDFDAGALERLDLPSGRATPPWRVALNVYHLPFVDGTFTAATMIRVHHHLERPRAAFFELARVLGPSARLLVSYNPRPTVGTLAIDLGRALHRTPEGSVEWISFSRHEPVTLPPDPFPVFVGRRSSFLEDVEAAGLTLEREFVSGLEEFSMLRRHLPTRWFIAWSRAFGRLPAMPMRWVVLARRESSGAAQSTRNPFLECLACPRCRAPLRVKEDADPPPCGRCGFRGIRRGKVLDLRYRRPSLSSPRPDGGAPPVRPSPGHPGTEGSGACEGRPGHSIQAPGASRPVR